MYNIGGHFSKWPPQPPEYTSELAQYPDRLSKHLSTSVPNFMLLPRFAMFIFFFWANLPHYCRFQPKIQNSKVVMIYIRLGLFIKTFITNYIFAYMSPLVHQNDQRIIIYTIVGHIEGFWHNSKILGEWQKMVELKREKNSAKNVRILTFGVENDRIS